MAIFNYVATSADGKKTDKGTVNANDEKAALEALKRRGLKPLSVTEAKKGFSFESLLKNNSVKSDDLVIFTRQLSAMVGAGVPLLRSLGSLEQHSESEPLRKILTAVIGDVEGGMALADALEKHPKTFSDVYVNMVRAGETAGILDEILNRLAIQQEKNASIRKKVKGAMTYPTVLLVITILAFFGLMLFVIPQIGNIIKSIAGPDAELPLITKMMLGFSDFILSPLGFLAIAAMIGGVIALLRYIKTPKGKKIFHTIVLKLPAIKTVIQKVIVARFARTFSALSGAGVSIIETMTVTSHALGNVVYEESLLNAVDKVKNGEQLSKVLEEDGLYPAIVSQMLSVGEETGQTDTVLVKVAEFYEEEVDTAINSLSSIIEPVMIVVMGSIVGLIAASVMGPIAGLSNQIH
ncbi:type II secretion system F family protein [Candidatus Saccharibacteria bacterium]|nr:type II secretion system F family protein [Candidatus Saccharibacteria bacterium]